MLKFYQRLNSLYAIVLLCCLLVLVGCSGKPVPDLSPRYLSGLPDVYKDDVKVDPAKIRYRIILLGDGGEPKDNEPFFKTLGEWAKKLPEKTSIVFLGDNMYDDGLTRKKRHEADARLGPQLAVIIESQAHGLFIPGNHDWANGGKNGYDAVRAQERFINQRIGIQTESALPVFLPSAGAPGPVALDLPTTAHAVRLIVLDTQWWLHKHQKPYEYPDPFIADLKALLMTELPVIVVGHHPIETHGRHRGAFWKPMSVQDTNHKKYRSMVKHLNQAFSVPGKTSLLIYAAGHDHSLQVLKGSTADYLLVSGAASCWKLSKVKLGDNALFAYKRTGFMVVDFLESGKVLLRVVQDGDKGVRLSYPLNYSLEE